MQQHIQYRRLVVAGSGFAGELFLATIFFCIFYALYFSPVWLDGAVLAPGDASISYFPFFHKPWALISDQLLLGYPVEADLQVQANYLPKLLLPTYNSFVISAYVIMAVGCYAFLSSLTSSRSGAIIGAMIASGSGFMMAHLGHATIIHSACWVPWVLWAFQGCSDRLRWPSVCVGAVAVSLSLLGGHPQISVIGFALAGAFWAFLTATAIFQRRAFLGVAASAPVIFGFGLMLSAISVIPFAELAGQGIRAGWSLGDFDTFSELPRTLLLGLFPGLFGTHPATFYGPYTGPWNLTELAFYAGVGPVLFSLLAVITGWRRPAVVFWGGAAVMALLVSMGAYTPVGRLVYHLPVLGSFRAQGRYGLVFILAIAVLVSWSVAEIRNRRVLLRDAFAAVIGMALVMAGGVICVARMRPASGQHVGDASGHPFVSVLHNPSVYVPCIVTVLAMVLLLAWVRVGRGGFAFAAFVLVTADLATFGFFYEWRFATLSADAIAASPATQAQVAGVRASGTRVMPVPSSLVTYSPFSPQVNVAFGIPLASNYGPLLPRRADYYAQLDTTGHPRFDLGASPLPDILGVGWFARSPRGPLFDEALINRGCGGESSPPYEADFAFPPDARGARIRVVSHMACSTVVDQGESVASASWSSRSGRTGSVPIRAGIDTAEWAIDRPGLAAKHQKATVASSFDAPEAPGHDYVTEMDLDGGQDVDIDALKIQLAGQRHIALRIRRIELVDSTGRITPAAPSLPGLTMDYSNPAVALARRDAQPPLQWLACSVRILDDVALKAVLAGGSLPDETRFEVHRTALLEQGHATPAPTCRDPGSIGSVARSPSTFRAIVEGGGSQVLVISQLFYPGWVARIDGVKARIFPVDGVIQGVLIPAGRHEVELSFRPKSFYIGAALTGLAVVLLLAPCIWRRRRANTQQRVSS